MHPTLCALLDHGPVLTDGAWGTRFEALGLPAGETPDLWNLSRPEKVLAVATSYVEAGSRVILTNTFRANRIALAAAGAEREAAAINREGAAISRRAAGDRARVFGSMGPTGKMLFAGEVEPGEVRVAFEEQAAALLEGGADGLVVETFGDVAEMRLAVEAARGTGLVVVASMTFDSGRHLDRTMTGTTPEAAGEAMAAAGADVVGANCGQGIETYAGIGRRLRSAASRPLWLKPNAGIPEVANDRAVYRTRPKDFAVLAPHLVEAGADFLGGCCGTDPDFIRALAETLRPAPPLPAS